MSRRTTKLRSLSSVVLLERSFYNHNGTLKCSSCVLSHKTSTGAPIFSPTQSPSQGRRSPGKRSPGPAAAEGVAPPGTLLREGLGTPRDSAARTPPPSPVTTVSVSPRAAGAAGLTLGTGTGDLGGRTQTRPRWTLSQTHTPGTEQRTEAPSVSLPGRSFFCHLPPPPWPPHPPVLSRKIGGLCLSVVGNLQASLARRGFRAGTRTRHCSPPFPPSAKPRPLLAGLGGMPHTSASGRLLGRPWPGRVWKGCGRGHGGNGVHRLALHTWSPERQPRAEESARGTRV